MKKLAQFVKKACLASLLTIPFWTQAQQQTWYENRSDLYTRTGNVLKVSPSYHADSIYWEYVFLNPASGMYVTLHSTEDSIQLTAESLVQLKVVVDTFHFIKTELKVPYLDPNKGKDRTNAITDSLVIQTSGLQLRPYSFLHADSAVWKVRNDLTHDSSTFIYSSPEADSGITVSQNATVTAWIKTGGFWYEQLIQFNGVTQDTVSGELQAPLIPNAHYLWYYNEQVLAVSTPYYTPTHIGTYKVVITWESSGSIQRLDGENRAEFVYEVTSLPMTTGLFPTSESATGFGLYPNPANGQITIVSGKGAFEYHIENLASEEVAQGQGTDGASISIDHLIGGVYFVRIKTADKEVARKLIVN